MQSNGGFMATREARRHAIRTVLSGPAGGVVGAMETARLAGFPRILGFDMGGTSTDVSLVDGHARETMEASIDGFPVRVPMLDIHTVGAGGGSIARVDEGRLLRGGPRPRSPRFRPGGIRRLRWLACLRDRPRARHSYRSGSRVRRSAIGTGHAAGRSGSRSCRGRFESSGYRARVSAAGTDSAQGAARSGINPVRRHSLYGPELRTDRALACGKSRQAFPPGTPAHLRLSEP